MKNERIYTYDAENQLTSVTYENGVVVTYTYDKAGNRISVTSTGNTVSPVPVMGAGPAESGSQKATPSVDPAEFRVCGNCGTPVQSGRKFCSRCGAPVGATIPAAPVSPAAPQPPSVCPGCGSPLKAGIKFCGDCGRHL